MLKNLSNRIRLMGNSVASAFNKALACVKRGLSALWSWLSDNGLIFVIVGGILAAIAAIVAIIRYLLAQRNATTIARKRTGPKMKPVIPMDPEKKKERKPVAPYWQGRRPYRSNSDDF